MSIADFFFGRKQNKTASRRSAKLNRNAVRTRTLSMEPLETRDLLSVTTGLIDDSAYAALREQYPEFNLPEDQSTLNVMTVDLDEGATDLKLEDLKSAISTAGTTEQSDLILVKTSDSANSVVYTNNTDEITIDIDSTQYGSITIIGWGEQFFTLDANQQSRVMSISGASTVVNLSKLTLQNGNTDYGAGINNDSGTVNINNCKILHNEATADGGGIRNINTGALTITTSLISNNSCGNLGGGIANSNSIMINDSSISDNSSTSNGGGIFNTGGTIVANNSNITGNVSLLSGGGIQTISSGTISLTKCNISDNASSTNGGGINISSRTYLTVTDCIISNNISEKDGGGIAFTNSRNLITLKNSRLINNFASGSGGGLVNGEYGTVIIDNCEFSGNQSNNGGGIYNKGVITVTNSTIAGNHSINNGGGISNNVSLGTVNVNNSIISYNYGNQEISNLYGNLSTDNNNIIDVDPGFVCSPVFNSDGELVNADTMDLHLQSDSIAIDNGDYTLAANIATDIDGYVRVYGDNIDIGAYEIQGNLDDNPYSSVVNTLNDSFDLNDDEWSLREAIYYALEYVTITFADNLDGTISLTHGQLLIDKALSIDGDSRIVIDAEQKSRIFYVMSDAEESPVILNNLTILNGKADSGGGIFIKSGSVRIADCEIMDNVATAGDGGGINNENGSLYLTNSTISGNTVILDVSKAGGGLANSGDATIINCEILDNSAQYGGGINNNKSIIFENSIVSGNVSSIDGGGIRQWRGTLSITASNIYSNSANDIGGGILVNSGIVTIDNSVIIDNSSLTSGGALYNRGMSTITNCTISGNNAAHYGGGICNNNNGYTISYNSIIACNTASSDAEIYLKSGFVDGYNNISTFSDWSNGNDNFLYDSSKPLFVSTTDYHLADNSQTINKGNNSYAVDKSGQPLTTDLAGIPRIIGGTVDLGAYEYDSRTALSVPELSIVPNGTFAVVNVSPVENAIAYRIEYSLYDDFTDSITIDAQEGENVLNDLQLLQTYYVRVKSIGNDDYTDSDYSDSQSFVTVPTLTGLTLSTDSPTVGTTITTTLAPIGATASYQWYCGETEITGATDSSFKVTEAQIGKTITCVATGTGDYSGTISATTTETVPALPLDTPVLSSLNANNTVVVANWSLIDNADSYTFEYQLDGSDNWTITTGIQGTSTAFIGNIGSTYNVRVKANGTGNYSDSPYSEIVSITLSVPPTPLSGLTLSTYAPEVGTTITASFEQSDITADYQWYCGTTIIDGADESSFTVTEEQIGQTITCIATGTGNYTGTVSATTAVVPAFELYSPVLSSLNTVGSIVVAEWSDVDNADGYTLEYKPEDSQKWTSISGLENTTAAFVGVAGTTYNVRVKANGTGTYSDSSYSAIASITLSVPLTGLTLSTTSPEVGTVITTTLSPSGATVEYQWYSGETEMDGATGSSFTVTEDQIGQTIMCVATGADGYTGTVSATTAVVPALALDVPGVPELTLDGTTVNAAWSAVENASGYTLEYQPAGADSWSVITGISDSAASFNGVAGATYNVRVKANGTGYYTDSEYSESASIYIPIPLTGLTLSTTTPEVGTIITTTLTPSDATVDYQWYSGETIIEGAETSSFTVTEDYIGQTITCVATANGAYTGSVSATTAEVPVPVVVLDAPADFALSVYNATVTASWSAVDNASSYTLEYKPIDSENWTALPGLQDTTASFDGVPGTMYNVRVKANGTDGYSDSSYSEVNTDKPTGPVVAINLNKVTVSWVDDSPAADAVRYRVAGTTKWTVKKLKAGVTSLTFNASIGVNYDIEVLLDQQETNVLQGSAIVLDQPKLKADKAFLKDDTFHVEVTNYAAKNLAANVKQAIVSVNGVMTTLNISNQQGECDLVNGGKVAFDNGRFTFSEMTSNTSYKVQISFSDGHSVSKTSSALTVKTTKTCYSAPVISSATAVSDTSITVTWETAYGKKFNTPAQKYTVQYSLDGVKWTNATTAATGNSYTIQKLKGGSVYKVRVLATKDSAFEASAPSEVLTAETLTAPKTAIEKNSINDDSFQLNVTNYPTTNLTKATSINVKSDQFGETVINLENGSGSAAFDNGMTVAFNNGALTFANAPSNTQQKIQVNFSDGVCTTAWSAALTVKTAIAPYNKPVLSSATAVSSTSVQVEWSPVVGKNSNTPAQSYTVQYTTDGTRWINANAKVVGTNFTITGLKTGTTYLVAVIANKDSRFNASLPSESRQVTTL